MSEKKTVSVLNFIKRNLYYFLIGLSLIIIMAVIAIVLTTNKLPSEGKKPESDSSPIESLPSESIPESVLPPNESNGGNTGNVEENKPVDTKIVFTMPVESVLGIDF